ncbi:MAG: transposase [Actinomyces sp.]|nr:transposase [Actinomyces sp.]
MSWLVAGVCVKQLAMPTTSFARKVSWCWQVDPPQPLITGEIYDQIIIDGIYLSHHWCLLIATNGSHVIGWQWCDRESVAAWQALLSKFPAPTVVITDGGPGALKAIRQCWPATGVQRCLFHVWLNTKTDLTGHPKTPAGKALLRLGGNLAAINTLDEAATWATQLNN